MKNKIFSITIIIVALLVSLLGGYLLANQKTNLGAGTVYIPILTNGVYVITASSTAQNWTAFEVSGTLGNYSVNSSKTASTTPVQLLAPNTGRLAVTVCNDGTDKGYVAVGATATSTLGQTGYFTTSTGILVPAQTCKTF